MLSANGGRNGFLLEFGLISTLLALLLAWNSAPRAYTSASSLEAALLYGGHQAPSQSSWVNFSPTGWSKSPLVTASVTVNSDVGLNGATAEYRFSTNGNTSSAPWLTSLTVTGSISTSLLLSVADLTLADSATLNEIQFKIDDQGGATLLSPLYVVQVDSTNPSSNITTPLSGEIVTSTSSTIHGTAFDATSGVQQVELSAKGGAWQTASGSSQWVQQWTIPSSDGVDYTLISRATDQAGNVESPGPGITVKVDNVDPLSNLTDPISGQVLSGTVYTLRGSASDGYGVSVVDVSIDGGAWQRATGTSDWSYNWALPTYGTFTIQSRAIDRAGLVETPGSGATVTVDNRMPASTITSPASGGLLSGSGYTIRGTASAGVTQVDVSVDGSTWAPANGTGSWEYVWTLPADGTYNVRSRAADSLGRTETPGPGVNVTVDNTSPTSGIASPTAGQVLSGTVLAVTGSAADANGIDRIEVSLGTMAITDWKPANGTSSWSHTRSLPTSDGASYDVRSRAIDRANNVELPGPGVTISIDNVAPVSSILAPANGEVLTAATYVVAGQASDGSGVALVQLSVDGGEWVNANGTESWSYNWSTPGDGSYDLRVRAVDLAGNVEPVGGPITVAVDRSGPVVHITAPTANQLIPGATFLVRGTALDHSGVDYVEARVDDGIWQRASGNTSWTYSWNLPADGTHSLQARGVDKKGNTGSLSPKTEVTVDKTPPTIAISSPTSGAILAGTSHLIAGTAGDATSGIEEIRVAVDGVQVWSNRLTGAASSNWGYTWTTGNEDGKKHNIVVSATDRAGNVGVTPGLMVTVDNVPPTASVDALPPTLSRTDIPLKWSGWDGSGIQYYDIQVRSDGGQWSDWLTRTSANGAVFLARGGHSYSFRARAVDLAGNVGTYAANGDASVTIPIFKLSLPLVLKPPPLAGSQLKVDRDVANGGDELLYSIEVRNAGSNPVTAAVSSLIPDNTSYAPGSASGGLTFNGSAVVWSGSVSPQGSRTFTFRVKVLDVFSGNIVNESIIVGGGDSLTLRAQTKVVVANGRFDIGNLGGWQHGGSLGVSTTWEAGRYGQGALFGSPTFDCGGGIPVDKAEMFQTVSVPDSGKPTLSFWFRMVSQDVKYSPMFQSDGDTLDVYVRDANGGNSQLLLRFGAPFRTVGCDRAPFDSGWQTGSFDLSAYRGQGIQVYFALWNRIDGWYNSYVYLDEIRVD